MDWRLRKQIIYGLIIFLIFFLIFLFVFLKFRKPVIATCFDGKKNQGEEGIDCGGPCPPCEIKYAEPLKIYPTKYLVYSNSIDIVGILENPNKNLALKKIKYYFEIYDFDGNLKATTTLKETNLEPETKKYLLEINYPKPKFTLGEIKLKIIEPQKEDFIKEEKEEIPVSYYNEKIISENGRWKIQLSLFNKSFQKQDIEVIGLVYNQNNNLIGIGKTKAFLNPQEVKDISVFLSELLTKPAGFEIYLQR
jgi:hypothetical protein